MKQVILKIDDSAYEKFMGMVSLCPQVEVVCESGITDVMNDRDQCMVYAIQTLRDNHVFRFGYDYTWVMMAINEGLIDDYERFRSPQAFLDYLYEIGIEKLPSRITLSLAYSKTFNHFPDWTFTDMDNPSEILRRKNVVRQFLSAFGTAKRGILNKILNNCFTAIFRPKNSFYLRSANKKLRMKRRIEVCSLDYLMFAYERRLEEDELLDEGYMEACDRLSAAEMRKSYVEYLRGLASY